jgi:hypothetical protein
LRLRPLQIFFLTFCLCSISQAYSVLTHEAIIDATWKDNLQPLLLKRFPAATEDELTKAHAYAYGGAIIQDIGYYPFGATLVSDLTHYVRSGDFILNLLSESQDLNEYAFALGALAHYAADNLGHKAVNRAVPMLFPKIRKKFGDIATYADNAASHIKAEFAFDVAQVAEENYAPDSYHHFIGFEVSEAELERAFVKTYTLELSSLIKNKPLAFGTYRFAVSSLIPAMTKAAWSMKAKELMKSRPGITKQKFVYNLSRASYHKDWGREYQKPGFRARLIAFLFRVIPKVGPFKAFAFHPPTPETEKMFMESVNKTLDQYRALLAAHGQGALKLPNENFDIGEPIKAGKYRLADDAYATLIDKLHGKPVPPELRADILAFYSDLNVPFATKKDLKAWQKVLQELDELKAAKPSEVSR